MHTEDIFIGRLLDNRYKLRHLISRGGMASVYRALRLSIGDTVAVKVLAIDENLDPIDLKRFQLEASASASIKHPNIISIYDFGLLEDIAYIVMEYMEGSSLAREIARCGTLSLERTFRIFRQIASAVTAAHKQGVIHRDLKPSNIIFQKANCEDDLVKVVDFGIAKLIKEGGEKLTSADFALGTPEYMSPEQCLGQKLDERSDIYSLGIVLYEMLTGQTPFSGEIASAILVKHAIEIPRPISSINPAIPSEVEAVVMKALEKKPEARFHSANEFATELEIAIRNAEAARRDASLTSEWTKDRSDTVKLHRLVPIQFEEKPHLEPSQTEMVRAITRLEAPLKFSFERFVGRHEELKKLRERFELVKKGVGQSFFITGDPGIGKTELVNQLQKSLTGEQFIYLVCKFYEYANDSHYRPYLDSLHSFSRNFVDRSWPEANSSGMIQQVVRQLADIDTLLNLESESLQAQSEEIKYRTFEALSGIFLMLAERYPVILLLDDIHWADSLSLEFLSYLLRSSERSKLFIVSTLRQQDLQDEKRPLRAWVRRFNRHGSFNQLKLSALSRTEASTLIHTIFGGLRTDEDILERLHRTSGGNPYYLCEIVRQLVQEGRIFWDSERWHCQKLEDIDLPNSVLELVDKHLNRLSDDAVEVFTRAAVVGERFSLNLLQALTDLSLDALMDIIDTGLREYIIRESVSTDPLSDDCFTFYHNTLRRVLYERLSVYRRRRLHAQIAVKLEGLNPRRVDRIAGELAYHYFNGESFERALHYSIIAGDTFRKLFAIDDAVKYYTLAEEALTRMSESDRLNVNADLLGQLHLAYGDCLMHLGKTELARCQLFLGLEALSDTDSKSLKLRILCSLAELEWGCGNYTEALEQCNQALLLYREVADKKDLCRLYAVMGNAHFSQGDAEKALVCYEEELVNARFNNDVAVEAQALRHIGLICGWRGELEKALEHLEQALELAHSAANLENERQILMLCGNIRYEQGEMLQAAEYYKKSLAIARKTGRRRGECRVNVNMGEICRRLGDLETARTYFREALAIAVEIQDREIEGHALSNLGLLYQELGSLDLAVDHFQRALNIFKETNYHSNVEAEALFSLASIFRLQDRLDEAYNHFRQALEASRRLRLWQLEVSSLRSLADCEAAKGNVETASSLLEETLSIIDTLLTSNPSPQEEKRLLEIQSKTIDQMAKL